MADRRAAREWILKRIREQIYLPGERIDSVRTLAREIGVSNMTVSRAITELSHDGTLQTRPGSGCFVSPDLAVVEGRGTVALLLSIPIHETPADYSVFQRVLGAIQHELLHDNRAVLVLRGRLTSKEPDEYMKPEAVASRRPAGVLVLGMPDLRYLSQLASLIPVIVALDVDASDVGVDCVSFDNLLSGVGLVHRLVKRGARRIGWVGGPFPAPSSAASKVTHRYDSCARERFDGWRVGLSTAGLEAPSERAGLLGGTSRSSEGAVSLVKRMLRSSEPPDAIVTEYAEEVCEALREEPGDVMVAGWADGSKHDEIPQSLSIVAWCDSTALGKTGVELLRKRLDEGEGTVCRRLIEPDIVERQ